MSEAAVPAIPVLWLCGPPGVGKTSVGWQIYSHLSRSGFPAAYVDIDQLGICYPPPESDPARHNLKLANLNAVLAGFGQAGARCLVVSGVVDADRGIAARGVPRADLLVCRLRADRDELSRRLGGRPGTFARVDDALREADALDKTQFADAVVDTTNLAEGDVVGHLRGVIGPWPPISAHAPGSASVVAGRPTDAAGADGQILWLTGPTGVGKSTIGFRLYLKVLGLDVRAAYLDVDQLGFCWAAPSDHGLRAANVAAVWRNFRMSGAKALVVVGPVRTPQEVSTYEAALPQCVFRWCRLEAGPVELRRRVMTRQHGGSWSQPGDPLKGRSTQYLEHVARDAALDAEKVGGGAIPLGVDTDGLSVDESVDSVMAVTGWPRITT